MKLTREDAFIAIAERVAECTASALAPIDRNEAAARVLRAMGVDFLEGSARMDDDGAIRCLLRGTIDRIDVTVRIGEEGAT